MALFIVLPTAPPTQTRTPRYVIQPGSYHLSATLVYNTPVCYLGAGPNRSSVVIAAGQALRPPPGLREPRMFIHSGSPSNTDTITLSRLMIDGMGFTLGISGPTVILEDVGVKNCVQQVEDLRDTDGVGLYVGAVTAVNCSFNLNQARLGTAGAVYVRPGGFANFQQVGTWGCIHYAC